MFLVGASTAYPHVHYTDPSGIYVLAWKPGRVPIQIKLPTPTTTLIDGTTYVSSFVTATQIWNALIDVVQIDPQIGAEGTATTGNSINEIAMSPTYNGMDFPARTLAIAPYYRSGNAIVETDIIFNSNWSWDSYRGSWRRIEKDIQRVALHELGHLLGLYHPDQATPAQSVPAIMNSVISDLDALQSDDIAGAQLLYGQPGVRPANDRFAEAKILTLSTGSLEMTGSNIGSTLEAGEPRHAATQGTGSSWWRWTPPRSGTVTMTTQGSNFDTSLGLYTGSAVNGLTTVASSDDVSLGVIRTSSITASVSGGVTYSFAVDGVRGGYGQIALSLDYTPVGFDPPGRLVNLSVNTVLSPNEQVVPGFVIEGTGSRSVLIRAIGPGLAQFGVTGVLTDPTIALNRISGGVTAVVATNDNWDDSLASAFSRAGAFSITSGSFDAAIQADLAPGAYTVSVGGKAGNSGQVIVEAYEIPAVINTPSRPVNLSVNTTLSANEQVVPGFVIEGTRPRNVLIRAIGPGLTQFGVTGVLADPTITLRRISDGVVTIVATNDNWESSLAPIFSAAGAFALTPGSADAALQVNLLPGSYTVTVAGKSGNAGQVIVEVYEAP